MERHYPDYYHSDAILKSDDMSYCLGDMEMYPAIRLLLRKVIRHLKNMPKTLPIVSKTAFADFIGSGLTFGQASDYFDDWLYAVAVLEGEGCIQVSEAVRLWAEKSSTHLRRSAGSGMQADCRLIPSRLMPNVC